MPQQVEGPLEKVIEQSIRHVQRHRRSLALTDSGYSVPIPVVQIYIVGDQISPLLGLVLRRVHERLHKWTFRPPFVICSFLPARMQTGALSGVGRGADAMALVGPGPIPTVQWEGRSIADFCYLYEDMLLFPSPMFVQEIESYHAAAEGLFALISTALMTEPLYMDATALNLTRTTQRYENIGTLSVCQIIFPHSHLLEYCSAMLGVTLMDQWLADMRRSLVTEDKNKELRQRAENAHRCG